jgi:hypothetical protein
VGSVAAGLGYGTPALNPFCDCPSVVPFKPSDVPVWANAGLDNANAVATATIASFITVTFFLIAYIPGL